MYVSFECVEMTAPVLIRRRKIEYCAECAGYGSIMPFWSHGRDTIWIFREKARDRLYNSVAKKSAGNGPARKSWMGNLVGRMRLRSDVAQMKFKALLLSPILWDMLRHSCARYLDPATKARRYRYRYFTLSPWKYESSPTSRFQRLRELCRVLDKSYIKRSARYLTKITIFSTWNLQLI